MPDITTQEMYAQYAKPVYHFLLRLSGNPHDAEDLTAETFLRALKALPSFRGECKLQTWLFQIAKHVWYQELARRKNTPLPLDTAAPLSSPQNLQADVENKEQKISLYRRLQKLEAPTRDVMYLRLSGELTFAEIGRVLGKSENWARVTFFRGKERIKNDEEP